MENAQNPAAAVRPAPVDLALRGEGQSPREGKGMEDERAASETPSWMASIEVFFRTGAYSIYREYSMHLDGSSMDGAVRSGNQTLGRVEAKKQTFSSFDELLEKSEKPLLVDFYATWCGPCQYMVPILQEVSEKLSDKIQVVKIDTEKYTSIASRYRIEALPTFIIFKNGKPCYRFEGALPANQMIEQIESALAVTE
ncbi:hypothetical protein C2845_PM14G12080 [Panicum miliaceum]|uniref:Thioredoxin domain-containing protein n=1 Tax=Panicum miliaceum TaxID=4540 RepID=A0A3L6PQD1_PANMI|nr:hypothetical protein C2845_PM14G12080 [Panicum miliaceum]